MSVIWSKVWSDLWQHKVRSLLAALSIAAGVFALGVIFGMMDQLTPELNRVHQSISPAHVTMFLSDTVDQDMIDRLSQIEGVIEIEGLNQIPVRYRLPSDQEWRNGLMDMRSDYEAQTYNLLLLKAGSWPERDQLGIDIRAIDYLGLEFGDQVIFELPGTDRALPISGSLRDHYLTSPDFGDLAHFYADGRGLERFGIAQGQYNQLVFQVDRYSDAYARKMASEVKDRLATEGMSVGVTFYNDPEQHWGQQFFDGMYLVLQLLAAVALFMSVVLIYNTMSALITQQTDQIGVMKAIGGQSSVIIRVYLTGVLVYATLALLISLPLGAMAAYGVAGYFLAIFNISYDVFQYSTSALLIQTIAAVAVPLLAGLWPVLSGARITVREAIASYGLGGSFGISPLDRTIERIGDRFLSGPKAMALGNMFRRKGRLGLTQLVLITAGTLFLMVMTLASSINLTVNNDLARRNYHVFFQFEDNQRIDRVVDMAQASTGVVDAEVWFSQSAALLHQGQRVKEAGTGATLVGIPAASTMFRPQMTAGRWLEPGDGAVVVMNEDMAEENDIALGDTITLDLGQLGDRTWQVVGFYQELSVGFPAEDIYAPQEVVFQVTTKHNEGQRLVVQTVSDEPAYIEMVTAQLKEYFEGRNRKISDSQTIEEREEFFNNFFAQYIPMLLAPAIILAIVGGIGLMGALSISVVERTKEIGVMRAIGAKTPAIMTMLVVEGVLQGLFSWIVAAPLAFLLAQPLAAMMGQALFGMDLDYQFNGAAVLIWLVAVLLISIFASIAPARNATTISVRQSLAYA